jgi:predicted nuclease of predicted toxin-antitoxin system
VRILLDNCVPVRFAAHLQGYEAETAVGMGWDRKSDAELLRLMAGTFDVLITVDKKLSIQNRIAKCPFAIITLRAKTNQLQHLLQLLPKVKVALKRIQPGSAIDIT